MREKTKEDLAEDGMEKSVKHAEEVHPTWESQAYMFLINYITSHDKFMVENVRVASTGKVPEPPSKRAWGYIIRRAAKQGIVEKVGFDSVSNKKAHGTPAAVWRAKYH